ncbi:MAG: FtsX-like permease family protein [Pseudomonadota bacterium]
MTLLGVTLGVAVIVAIDIATSSSRAAMRVSLNTLYGNSTHQIGAGPAGLSPQLFGALRQRFPTMRFAPVIEERVRVGTTTLTVLGVDPLSEATIRPGLLTATGDPGASLSPAQLLTEPGGVLVSATTAGALGLAAGDVFAVHYRGVASSAKVLGLVGAVPADFLVTDLANIDAWRGGQGELTRVDVNAAEHPNAIAALRAFLPPSVTVVATEAQADATLGMTEAFTINLTAMSLLALLIGAFLIFNAISFSVVQRREHFAIYRALGLARSRVTAVVMREAVVFGLVGTALGLGLGVWLGQGLTTLVAQTVNDLYFRVTVTGHTLATTTLLKSLLLGIGFTLLASVPAAYEAARTRPNLAMRRSTVERGSRQLSQRLLPVALGIAVLALVTLLVSAQQLIAALVGLFLAIMAYALALPVLLAALLRYVFLPAAERIGRIAALTVGSITRNFSRTVVAMVALAVAVSATIGVSTMVGSFRGSVGTWLAGALDADIYIGAGPGGLTDSDRTAIARVTGVTATGVTRRTWMETAAGRVRIQAVDLLGPRGSQQLVNGDPATAWPAFARGDGVLISESHAYRTGLSVGDFVELPVPLGTAPFNVVGVYRSYDVNGGAVVMSLARYRSIWQDPVIDAMAVRHIPGSDTDALANRISAVFAGRRDVGVTAQRTLTERSMEVFDRTFLITDVLYWITVGIAFVGVTGALFALQLEQRTELGMLRAMGMSRWQTGRYVIGQSIIIGALAGLAAVPLGLGLAWLLVNVINRRAFGWTMGFETDGGLLIGAVVGSIVAAAIGALLPAIRTSQLRPADALRSAA